MENNRKNRIEITEIVHRYQRYCIKLELSLIFVWYEAWIIFSMRLNDCYSFHLRGLTKFLWQLSRQSRTPFRPTSKARRTHDRDAFKICFQIYVWGYNMYIKSRQENKLPHMLIENKKSIIIKWSITGPLMLSIQSVHLVWFGYCFTSR